MYADIHTHLLPDIDDGAKDLNEALHLLGDATRAGTDRFVVTPHFCADAQGLDEVVQKAHQRYAQLLSAVNQADIPVNKLLMGFEVRYFNGISRCDSLKVLCLNQSPVILLELQNEPITPKIFAELAELHYGGYTIVFAHVERFYKVPGYKQLLSFIRHINAVCQVNASSLMGGPFYRSALRLVHENIADVIASDMHTVAKRPSQLAEAYVFVQEKYGHSAKNRLVLRADQLYDRLDA